VECLQASRPWVMQHHMPVTTCNAAWTQVTDRNRLPKLHQPVEHPGYALVSDKAMQASYGP